MQGNGVLHLVRDKPLSLHPLSLLFTSKIVPAHNTEPA